MIGASPANPKKQTKKEEERGGKPRRKKRITGEERTRLKGRV